MRAKIQSVLNRKIRVKITRRKRGRFRVVIPAALAGVELSETFARKKDALTWLIVKLRCIERLTISVYEIGSSAMITEMRKQLRDQLQAQKTMLRSLAKNLVEDK